MASETIPADNLGDESQQWRRWVEESLKKQGKFSRNYGLHQRASDKQKDAFGRALREAGLSQSELDAAVKDAQRKPAAPANAQIATDAYLAADGTPQSRVSMSTNVVTVDVNGKGISVTNYQLYGRRNVAGTPWRMLAERESPVLVFDPLPIGEEWQFKIHPVSAAGVVGEASAALLVTMARDTTPPGKPAPMTATSRLGQVILSWNGKVEAGLANQPPDYSHSVVYVATSASAAGTAVGQIGTGGDTFYPPEVPYNQARWYFLVSYDKSGNPSPPSSRVSVSTKPLVNEDFIGEIVEGANLVDGSVTASEKIIGGTITGGLIQALAIEAGHIKANAITADKINAGAITTAKIAANAITADKIAANAITADKIAANAITADKIAANAINGKTITGALVRSAASGARTEMTNQGIQVLDGASNPLVRLGYGIATGMQVRNPNGGALIPLGPHVFGTQGFTRSTTLDVTAGTGGAFGAYVHEWYSSSPVSSPTGRMLVTCSAFLSPNAPLDSVIESIFDLRTAYNNSSASYVRAVSDMEFYGGFISLSVVVNVTASQSYYLMSAFRAKSATNGRVSPLIQRTMIAMPI